MLGPMRDATMSFQNGPVKLVCLLVLLLRLANRDIANIPNNVTTYVDLESQKLTTTITVTLEISHRVIRDGLKRSSGVSVHCVYTYMFIKCRAQ